MQLVLWAFITVCLLIAFVFLTIEVRNKKLLSTVTKSYRGTSSERNLVLKLLKYGIPADSIFHDLYLRKNNGRFSQIDLVVISKVGIIVFEVKDYSGWIFGTGYKEQWTKVLAYGKLKYRFYNPILQNKNHIKDLSKEINQFEYLPYFSIVVFDGDCELKNISFVPNGTYIVKPYRVLEVLHLILKSNPKAHYTNKEQIIAVLQKAVNNGESVDTQNQHAANVEDMLGHDRIFN